jgi:hypothetical protein
MKALALASLVLFAACFEPPTAKPPASGGPDAGISDPQPDAPGAAACIQAAPPPDGHHNAGQNCLTCHTGSGAPKWTAAGTLYADAAGTTAVAGATITLVDSTGKEVKIVTATNGNFWTSQALTPPLHPKASKCPSSAAMSGNAQGACNSCHSAGGSKGPIVLK